MTLKLLRSNLRGLSAGVILTMAVLAGGFGLLGTASARADTTLLSLTDMPASVFGTPMDVSFIATASTTTLSVAGYQVPNFWTAEFNSVTLSGGGANLLGGSWTFVPALSGSDAMGFSDETSVPALAFKGTTVGSFDTFSQTFATTPGAEYIYAFTFFNTDLNKPSGLLVTTSGSAVAVIPEPSTWTMMLIGFVGLGFAGYGRTTAGGAISA
jgi:hypothetical protein